MRQRLYVSIIDVRYAEADSTGHGNIFQSFEVRRCAMVTSRIWFPAALGAMEERTKCCGHFAGAGKEEQDGL
jgi:hypothetical protein